MDGILDQNTGAAWLSDERIASLVANAIRHFQAQRYTLQAWVVMPNHAHVVLTPLLTHGLDEILHSWKSYTAHSANRMLGRAGQPFWQRESYDHLIRGDAELAACCWHTLENPVKAGLCQQATDWPWSSASQQ